MVNAALLLALSCCAASPSVVVKPTNGPQVTGALVKLDSRELVLTVNGAARRFPVASLLSISTPGKLTTSVPKIRVTMLGNTLLLAREFSTKKTEAEVLLTDGRKVTVATRSINHVRWQLTPQLDGAWKEILASKRAGDSVVVRDGKSLDELEGVITDIDAERVGFTFDGKRRRVPRNKLAGIVYFHPGDRALPAAICKVTDRSGSQWFVKSMTLKGEALFFDNVTGEKSQLAVNQIVKMDFSTGNLVYLSDLEPQSVQWRPYVENTASQNLSLFFKPRKDKGFDGKKLTLGGQKFDKGFAVHSRTLMVFRMPGKFKNLTGLAGIHGKQGRGHVTLVIRGDNKQLVKKDIAAGDRPVPLNLNLTGIRRLTILVDFGKNLDVGDQLQLCEMRITK